MEVLLNMSNVADGKACKFFVFSFNFIEDWARRSTKVKLLMDAWKRVVRIAHNQAAVIRKEPTAFILEGPPGCRK